MKTRLAICLSLAVYYQSPGFAAEFDSLFQQATASCEQIDPRDYETGMWLNSEGYRSYYKQSMCFQRAAVEFRDAPLCDKVRRRFALFSSSWGYTRDNCRSLVETAQAEDRAKLQQLRQQYLAGPVKLTSLTVEKNGNGRDYDFIPRFADGFAYGYQLEFRVIDESRTPQLILQHGSYLTGAADNLRLFLYREQLRERFPDFEFGHVYELEVRVILSVGLGGIGSWMREEFLEEVFPEVERTQVFLTTASF